MNPATIVADIIALKPFSQIVFPARRRERSVQVAQTAEAIEQALACDEQKRAASVAAQRRRDATITLTFTWYE